MIGTSMSGNMQQMVVVIARPV
jgi:hypothetical protein